MSRLQKLPESAWFNVLVFLGYLALSILMTWPLVTRLGRDLAGAGTDVWIHQWTFWWVKEALQNGVSPFYTTLLYYPEGVSLTSHNIAWFNIALWLPLQRLLGATAAYNIVFILVLALNGFALYLLAKAETGRASAAFLGGLIFAFWPYTLSHFDHPNMMATFWAPLTMYFMLRIFQQGRLRDALLAGVSLALLGITRWQLLLMSAPILFAYGLYLYYREEASRGRRTAALLLLSLGLGALLMAPLAAPLVLDQFGRSGPEAVAFAEPDEGVTDLLSYVMPPDLYRAIWQTTPDPLPYPEWEPYHTISASAWYVPFIGLVTLALLIYGLWRQWSQTWFWLLVALGIIVMALGPQLAFNGRLYPAVPMPYRLLSDTLLEALIRRPHRLNVFLGIPVAMIAAWGMAAIGLRQQARRPGPRGAAYTALAALFLGALILWENPIPPIPTTDTAVPQWYRDLAADEEDFAILEIPFHNRGFDKVYMFYQTTHGKPLLVGHVSRLPQEAFSFLDSVPFLEPLNSIYTWNVVEESWVDFADVDVTRQLGLLAAENVRYIVLNKALIAPGFVDRWRDWVTFDAEYEDEEVLVYRTAPRPGEEFELAAPLAGGVGILRATIAPEDANQGGVVKADVRWAAGAPPAQDYQVCFYLVQIDEQQAAPTPACMPLVDGWPTSQWTAGSVARGSYVIPLAGDLSPGRYTMRMALARMGGDEPLGSAVGLGELTVAPVAPQFAADLCWQDGPCLRGYDLAQSGDELALDLYWQARETPEESYKRFLHLVEAGSGRVVAQQDSVPRDWQYPTSIWEPGEIVADRAHLSLAGLPAGAYELRSGWYAVDGGRLLPACAAPACRELGEDFHRLTTLTLP